MGVVSAGYGRALAGAFLAVPITYALQIILLSEERTRLIEILLSGAPPKESREE